MLLLLLMIGAVAGYDHSVNYWQAFAPGKLLQRLDALTASEVQPGSVAALAARLPRAQAKLDEDADDIEETDDEVETDTDTAVETDDDAFELDDDVEVDSHSAEGHSGEDYEKNYEQFVRQYFDRVSDESQELDVSVESQAEASNLQQQQKPKQKEKQRCKRVQRKGQLCKICREPSNNEVSETCSYSHEAEPEKYAYGSGTQYRRYRDVPQPESERREKQQRHTTVVQPDSSSRCERRLVGNSVCYECLDSGGQRLRRCYDAASEHRQSKRRASAKPGKKSEQEQRIYKRTISYSYEKGSNQDDVTPAAVLNNAATKPTSATLISSASSSSTVEPRARRLAKVVRRRVIAPAAAG